MRNGRTYRGDRKRRAKAMGLTLQQYARVGARGRELAAQKVHQMAMELSPEQARQALGIWAQSGGKINILTGEGVN